MNLACVCHSTHLEIRSDCLHDSVFTFSLVKWSLISVELYILQSDDPASGHFLHFTIGMLFHLAFHVGHALSPLTNPSNYFYHRKLSHKLK